VVENDTELKAQTILRTMIDSLPTEGWLKDRSAAAIHFPNGK